MLGIGLVAAALAAPAHLVVFTHIDGPAAVDTDEAVYDARVARLATAMDLFEEHGAVVTFEANDRFAKGEQTWGGGLLAEAVARGHGVTTHADYGVDITSTDTLANRMRASKARIDALVGAEHNRGISGGTGPADWVRAATAAGFAYVTGTTGLAYLSMPLAARPAGWTNSYIRAVTWHDPAPVELRRRLAPMRLLDARDFSPDPLGALWLVAGGLGALSSLGEGDYGCGEACALDSADLDALDDALDDALAARDPARPAVVQVHVPLRLYTAGDRPLLDEALARLDARVAAGELRWSTTHDVWAALSNR